MRRGRARRRRPPGRGGCHPRLPAKVEPSEQPAAPAAPRGSPGTQLLLDGPGATVGLGHRRPRGAPAAAAPLRLLPQEVGIHLTPGARPAVAAGTLTVAASFRRASGRWSSRAAGREEPSPGVLSVVKLSEPGPSEGGAAQPAGASSCSGTDGTSSGDPGVPGPPPLHAPPGSTPRTPDFLRHRQLPLVPGDPQTPAAEAPRDAEGPIYESIRYKSRKLSAGLRKPCGATGDSGDPGQGLVVQEEPCGDGSPCPVYARVRKAPRAPQRSAPSRGPEPEEEAPPALPEKRFDDL